MAHKRTLIIAIGLAACLLALGSWWMLQSFSGRQLTWPTASAASRTSLDDPPYLGLEINYGDGVKRPISAEQGVQVRYQTRRLGDQEGEVTATLENRSPTMGFVVMYLTRSNLNLSIGEHAVLKAVAKVESSDKSTELVIGYHLVNDRGHYVTEFVPPSARAITGVNGEQALSADFARGADAAKGDMATVSMVLPRIAIYNIAAGAKVRFTVRWQSTQVQALPVLPTGWIEPWDDTPRLALPGQAFKLRVQGTGLGKAWPGAQATLSLRQGAQTVVQWQRPADRWMGKGLIREAWRLPLDDKIPPGDYELTFALNTAAGATAQTLPLASEAAARTADGQVRLGTVRVQDKRRMLIGNAFHRYPGISEYKLGPVQVDYQFARSYASEFMHVMQWWTGEDRYDWEGVDRWAAFHAGKGQKRLLVVFTGSPTWASAMPGQVSGMGVLGNAAPPAKDLWPAYGRMVKATVKRLKGRLVGVECWNEPDLPKFFTGSATEMADLCALVHDNTKAVDPSIPVICPQPSHVQALGLVYSAKTSSGQPLHELCDYVGSHLYDAMGDDAQGEPYDQWSVSEAVQRMRQTAAKFGIRRPIAITEYGLSTCQSHPTDAHPVPFNQMSEEAAGEALYQSLGSLQAEGVALVGLYSYDHGNDDPRCRPGGSYVRTMSVNDEGQQRPAKAVISRINQAIKDFGAR